MKGYPTLVLYRNSEKLEVFNGARELDKLNEFIGKHQSQFLGIHLDVTDGS